jgi:hypothetical protein
MLRLWRWLFPVYDIEMWWKNGFPRHIGWKPRHMHASLRAFNRRSR